MIKQSEITLVRFLRIVLIIIGAVAAYLVLKSLSGVLLPLP